MNRVSARFHQTFPSLQRINGARYTLGERNKDGGDWRNSAHVCRFLQTKPKINCASTCSFVRT